MRRVAVASVAVVMVLAGCSGGGDGPAASPAAPSSSEASTFTVDVSMQVSRVGLSMNHGDRCFTTDGFTDIGAGTQVKILDANGKVIALGELGAGSAVDKFEGVPGTEYCLFKASVPDVPLVDLFGVEVSHRGVVNFKRDGDPTEAALTLG